MGASGGIVIDYTETQQDLKIRYCVLTDITHLCYFLCICLDRQFSVLVLHNETQFQTEDFQLGTISKSSHVVYDFQYDYKS
jgi:hypothetical protein